VPRSYKYLLGDARRERARLRAQADLWDPVSRALFDRLGIRRGWRVLEIGPGSGSLHLDLRRRVAGPVDAVEQSPVFASQLAARIRRDGFGSGRTWLSDLSAATLPSNHYDLIFARWVFLFLPRPESRIRQLAAALKPGGRLVVQDYHRETLALIPRPPEWRRFVDADLAFFASQGGDVSIGGRLPALFRRARLRLDPTHVTIKTGRPGSAVWRWLSTYVLGVMDRYAEFPPFTREDARRLRRHWLRASRDPAALLIGPAVLDVVGRKPRKRRHHEGLKS
jgi:SAM-dependent methyltransferase